MNLSDSSLQDKVTVLSSNDSLYSTPAIKLSSQTGSIYLILYKIE